MWVWSVPGQLHAQTCTAAAFCPPGTNVIDAPNFGEIYLGTAAVDCLVGRPGPDLMIGAGNGGDFICGGGGNDVIIGSPGNDTINGDDGDDEIAGQLGADTINGGGGNDVLQGNEGPDTINGGAGADIINGGPDDDILSGGLDNDTIRGDGGIDEGFGGLGLNVCIVEIPDANCQILNHASVDSFYSVSRGGSVVVGWVTSSEAGTVGFDLMREVDGEWTPVTPRRVPGLLTAPQGGIYEVRDPGAEPGQTERYLLVEVTVSGIRSEHGPYEVSAASEGVGILQEGDWFAHEAHAIAPLLVSTKSGDVGPRQSDGPAEALYIGVDETGVYAVNASAIAGELGVDEATVRNAISTGGVSVTEGGQSVAWYGSGDGSQLFFWGAQIDSLYTTERPYRLSLQPGDVMSTRSVAPAAITAGLTYEDTVRAEEDQVAFTIGAVDPEADYWHYWPAIFAGQSRSVTLPLESLAGDGTVRVELVGASESSHSVEVRVNGNLVGTATGTNFNRFEVTVPVSESALTEGDNTVLLTTGSDVFLDEVEITYERSYETAASQLAFRSEQATSLELTGLVGTGIQLFDVTDPRQPVRLTEFVADGSGVRFAAQAGAEYFALAETEVRSPASIWADVPSNLSDPGNAFDHLILAPAAFKAKAEELADYRQQNGLRSTVVELQDIYDEFSFGVSNPNAIRDFLRFANETWSAAPEYIVLVGKGSFDYRDLQGMGGNFFPPILAPTTEGLYSSDNKYADIVGNDTFPDLAIGRLPVTSVEELDSAIAQIRAYETAIDSLGTDVILFADALNPDGDYSFASDLIGQVFPGGWSLDRVYRSEFDGVGATRTALFDALAQGPRALNYMGHSAITELGFLREGLFNVDDAIGLSTDGPQALFTTMTCSSSRFTFPGLISLGEALFSHDRAAIAVWGPTGLSNSPQAGLLAEAFYEGLTSGGERVGALVRDAFPAVREFELSSEMATVYHLFGDPALRVNKAGTPGTGGTGGVPGDGGSDGSGGSGGVTANPGGGGGCSVGAHGGGFGDGPLGLFALLGVAVAYRRLRRRRG